MNDVIHGRIGCALAKRLLSRERPAARRRRRPTGWVGRHVDRCRRCRTFLAALAEVDRGLRNADRRAPEPRGELRARVLFAFHHTDWEEDEPSSEPLLPSLGWERPAWAVGSLAALVLVVSLAWSRLDDFRTVPRTVRIELPEECRLVAEPTIVVRRASGVEELR